MIELRFVRRPKGALYQERILQYRTQEDDDGYWYWSKWQDVPEVDEDKK